MSPIFKKKFADISRVNNFIKYGYDKDLGIKLHKGILSCENFVPSLTHNNAIIRKIKLIQIDYKETNIGFSPVVTTGGIGASYSGDRAMRKVEGRQENFIASSNPIKLKILSKSNNYNKNVNDNDNSHDENDNNCEILTLTKIDFVKYCNDSSSGDLNIKQLDKLKSFADIGKFKYGEILYKEKAIVDNSCVYCVEKMSNNLRSFDVFNTTNPYILRYLVGNYYNEWSCCNIIFVFTIIWIIVKIVIWLIFG